MGGMAKLTVDLSEELLRRFKLEAVREGRSMSDVIRDFVEWWTAKREAGS